MAYVISILSEDPDPRSGEKVLLLSLSSHPQYGYRLKALSAATDRQIARWISDCALAISESGMLWASRYGWTVQLDQESLDIQKVLDTVPGITPTHAQIHPRDALALLMENLPPKDPSSPETGAVIQLRSRQLTGPVTHQGPAPVKRGASRRRLPDGEARDLALFLRDTIRALTDGADPEQVRQAVAEGLSFDVDVEPAADPRPDPRLADPRLAEPRLADPRLADPRLADPRLADPRPDPRLADPRLADPRLADPRHIQQPQPTPPVPPHYAPSNNPLPPLPAGVRALQPGETLENASPEVQADLAKLGAGSDADREKLFAAWEHDAKKYGGRPALSPEDQAEVNAWHADRRAQLAQQSGAAARAAHGVPDGAPNSVPQMTPPSQAAVPVLVPPVTVPAPENGHGQVYDPLAELTPWTQRCLTAAGLLTPDLVARFNVTEFGKVNGVGPKVVTEVGTWLVEHGLQFAREHSERPQA